MSQVIVENFTSPGRKTKVDATKYHEMRGAYLAVLPDAEPGMTPAEILAALLPRLSAAVFPEGKTAGWWAKCLQLDLEAKGIIRRSPKSPVRLHKL